MTVAGVPMPLSQIVVKAILNTYGAMVYGARQIGNLKERVQFPRNPFVKCDIEDVV